MPCAGILLIFGEKITQPFAACRKSALPILGQHRAVIFAKSGILSYEIRHPLPQMPYSDYNK